MARELVLDLSSYQAGFSIDTFKSLGVKKHIVKVTEGTTYVNPYANVLVNRAAAAGADGFAFYHFARFGANVAQAKAEAQFFINTAKSKFNLAEGATLICDAELQKMSTDAVIAFLDTIKASGYQTGFYTYKFLLPEFDLDRIKPHMDYFWLASYPTKVGDRNPTFGYFPSANYVDLWQYTDNFLGDNVDASITVSDRALEMFNPKNSVKVETPKTETAVSAPKTWVDNYGWKWVEENGTFTSDTAINLRWGATPQSDLISVLPAGSVVKYNAFSRHGGYVWLRQPRVNGKDGYLICREGNTPLGSFK